MERDADKQRDRNNGAKTAEGATDTNPTQGEEGAEGVDGTTEVSKGTYDKAKDDAVKDIHG